MTFLAKRVALALLLYIAVTDLVITGIRVAWNAPSYWHVATTYEGLPAVKVGAFETYDRPDLGSILTSGAPFTAADHRAAARQALAETGRNCAIVATTELMAPEFEHHYRCE
jgi:hypothetical protein